MTPNWQTFLSTHQLFLITALSSPWRHRCMSRGSSEIGGHWIAPPFAKPCLASQHHRPICHLQVVYDEQREFSASRWCSEDASLIVNTLVRRRVPFRPTTRSLPGEVL